MRNIRTGLILTIAILAVDLVSNVAEAGATTFCHRVSQTPMSQGGPYPSPNIGCEVDWIATPGSPINLSWTTGWACVFAQGTCVGVQVPADYQVGAQNITFAGGIKKYAGNCVLGLFGEQEAVLTWEPSNLSAGPFVTSDVVVGPIGLSGHCGGGGIPPY